MVQGSQLITKESQLFRYGNLKGLNIGLTANIVKYLQFSINYYTWWEKYDDDSNKYIDDENNSFYTGFEIDTSIIPKVRVAVHIISN